MKRLLFAAVVLSISFLFSSCTGLLGPDDDYERKWSASIRSSTKDVVVHTPSSELVGDSLKNNGNKRYRYTGGISVLTQSTESDDTFKGNKWVVEFTKDSTSTKKDSLEFSISVDYGVSRDALDSSFPMHDNRKKLVFPKHKKMTVTFNGMWPDSGESPWEAIKE